MRLNRTDRFILDELQNDGRLSNVALAEKVNLSESACQRRVKALESAGVIERYSMILNQQAVGITANVFVEITLKDQKQGDLVKFEKAIQNIPEVMECYLMSGDYDYLVRVVVTDLQDYERLHRDKLTKLPAVSRVRSSFSLRAVTKRTQLPLKST
ncbi:MAG: Lrp/AsnC family transcriptional regulator [Halieaceae bacterium]|nr:Lrp/AsnC family transcriptional regulator [Halieaceae bacterium]